MKTFKNKDLDGLQNKELIKHELYKQGYKCEFNIKDSFEINSSEIQYENLLIIFHKRLYGEYV